MNKFIPSIILLLSFFISSCTKSVQTNVVNPDQAKLEQIKKALAEQAQSVNKSEIPGSEISPIDPLEATKLVSIRVSPPSLSMVEGTSDYISVFAIRANGEEITVADGVRFVSLNSSRVEAPTTPELSRFAVKSISPGRTSLAITYQDMSTELEVLVKSKQILSLDIMPKSIALGTPTRFRLNAVYDNGTQAQIPSGITWNSTQVDYLSGDSNSTTNGIYTGAKVGFGGISASYQGQSIVSRVEIKMPKIISIAIQSDNTTFFLGTIAKLKAIATFASANTFDISSSVQWNSTDTNVASVSTNGEFEALFPGETQIRGSYGTVSGSESFFVTSVDFVDIRLESTVTTVPSGLTLNFKLWGIKADNSELEITDYGRWTSSDPLVLLSMSTEAERIPGRFQGLNPGTATVTARYGSRSKTVTVTVSEAAVVGLTMTSENPDGECGINEPQMQVRATLSDGNNRDITGDVTYSVDPPTAGVPHTEANKKGLISTTAAGTAKVIASYLEAKTGLTHTAELPLVVSAGKELGVGIQSAKDSIAYGEILELKAGQIMSCGQGNDFTGTSSWLTDNNNTAINSYINTAGSKGILTTTGMDNPPSTSPKTIKVSVIKGSFNAEKTIEVRPKEIKSITVQAAAVAIDVGTTTQLVLRARYSDATTVDITDISAYPGYTLQYSLQDCTELNCATVDANTGLVTAGAKEGRVKVFATLTTPQAYTVVATKVDIDVRSRCASGTRVGLYCLFKGTKGQTCDATCSTAAGTYHSATASVFGKGGLATDCDSAIKAFGFTNGLETPNLNNGNGLGCSIYEITALGISRGVRESATTTTANASHADFYRICACTLP